MLTAGVRTTVLDREVRMTAPFTRIAPDALTRFTQSDERALEQIFRDEYDALTALAAAEVGDAAAAPRLVEGAFYEAWQKRDGFASPGDLEYFLRRAIHQAALREKGRRAALHRFAEKEGAHAQRHATAAGPVGVDEAWRQLEGVLHAPTPDAEHAAHVRHDQSRHGAAAHVAHIGEEKRSGGAIALMVAVGALVLVGIVVLVRLLSPTDPVAMADAALESSETREVATRPGLRANMELADGSRASLGPDSRLRIPPGFGERVRAVGVEGTARFQVAPGQDRAFIVRAGNTTITATGTAFEVSGYPGTPVLVRVREGSVDVLAAGPSRSLAAGEAVVVDAEGVMTDPTAGAVAEALGWTDGEFHMADRPMRELPALLQRWYGMQVLVGDSAVLDRRVTLRAPLDSQRALISAIEQQGKVRYASTRDGTRLFRDAAGRQ
jgi:transmembrane sensor